MFQIILLVLFINIKFQQASAESPHVDFYEWSKLIDSNLLKDFYKYIVKIPTELDPLCLKKLIPEDEYAECYNNNLNYWKNEHSNEKLKCCFLWDYEECIIRLIDRVCGRDAVNKYTKRPTFLASKSRIKIVLNCEKFKDSGECRSSLWIILLVAVAVSIPVVACLVVLIRRLFLR